MYLEILRFDDPYCLGIGKIADFALPKHLSLATLEVLLLIIHPVANLLITAKILLPYSYYVSFQCSYRELSRSLPQPPIRQRTYSPT